MTSPQGTSRLLGALAGMKAIGSGDSRSARPAPASSSIDGVELSPEQLRILASGARLIKVQAFAGTGKTTLLRALARQSKSAKGIYLAFNTSIANHAASIFPSNIDCRTHNGMALRALRAKHLAWRDLRDGKIGHLGVEHLAAIPGMDGQNLEWVLQTIVNYMQSAAPEIDEGHFPLDDALFFGNNALEVDPAPCIAAAREAWRHICDPSSLIPIPHDGYLKLWSQDPGQLDFDFVMVDESQDSNPAFLAGMSPQKARQIFVGDEHQGIYAFRGAINALSTLTGFESRALTLTHRFGHRLAMLANAIISAKGGLVSLSPSGSAADTQIAMGACPLGIAPLCLARSNAGLFGKALELSKHGKKFHLVGGAKFTFSDLSDLMLLSSGDRQNGAYRAYATLDDLSEAALAQGRGDLALRAKLAKKHGADLPEMLKSIGRQSIDAGKAGPDAPRLSTLHQAKGLESPWVEILDDFPASGCMQNPPAMRNKSDLEEANILYVALTRAKEGLALTSGPAQEWAKRILASAPAAATEAEQDLF